MQAKLKIKNTEINKNYLNRQLRNIIEVRFYEQQEVV